MTGCIFPVNSGLMGMFDLCNFIVAYRFGAVRFLFIYFQMFSFDMLFLHCFNVCFLTNIKINNECRHVTEQITQ